MKPLVTIVINNYNYASFLPEAIDSAIGQSYAPIEIIVVDDGSTDSSRQIISRYGDKIIPVIKSNGGQASAFNAGVTRSRGSIICFLDSDDYFTSDKVAKTVAAFEEHDFRSKPMMVHHPLSIVGDTAGELSGRLIGRRHESPLNLYDFARQYHFIHYRAGPTTSLSLNRALIDRLFPIPEDGIKTSADDFIVKGASLVGELYSLNIPLGYYRIHGHNAWFTGSRRKPLSFHQALDDYLNKLLVETGHLPVMSFSDSMEYWTELALQRRWLALVGHIAKLAVAQRDLVTMRFAYRILRLAVASKSDAEWSERNFITTP